VFRELLKMLSWDAWVERPVGLIKEHGGAQALKVICKVAKWEQRVFLRRAIICN
jgi:hypothetical protein